MKKFGFTLSEVLVTLGVIGVVAALTVPTLMQNAQKKVYVTSLKKEYSLISQAFQNAMTDKNATKWSDVSLGASALLRNYFKLTMNPSTAANYAMNNSFSNVDGSSSRFDGGYYFCASIKDGSALCIHNGKRDLYIDTNGKQGPNVGGRDIFRLWVTDSGDVVGYRGYGNVSGYLAAIPPKERNFTFFPAAWAASSWVPSASVSVGSVSVISVPSVGSGITAENAFSRIVYDGWEMNY